MNIYTTEAEQIEQIKKWWREYGKLMAITLLISLLMVFAWRTWQNYKNKQLQEVSLAYSEIFSAATSQDQYTAQKLANKIITQDPHTPYAAGSALFLASLDVDNNNFAEANHHLQWAIDHAKDPAIRQVARLRLARLLIAEHQPQAALKVLNKVENSSYGALIDIVKGDSYVASGQLEQAQTAYQAALAELPAGSEVRNFIQMRYDNLPTNTVVINSAIPSITHE